MASVFRAKPANTAFFTGCECATTAEDKSLQPALKPEMPPHLFTQASLESVFHKHNTHLKDLKNNNSDDDQGGDDGDGGDTGFSELTCEFQLLPISSEAQQKQDYQAFVEYNTEKNDQRHADQKVTTETQNDLSRQQAQRISANTAEVANQLHETHETHSTHTTTHQYTHELRNTTNSLHHLKLQTQAIYKNTNQLNINKKFSHNLRFQNVKNINNKNINNKLNTLTKSSLLNFNRNPSGMMNKSHWTTAHAAENINQQHNTTQSSTVSSEESSMHHKLNSKI